MKKRNGLFSPGLFGDTMTFGLVAAALGIYAGAKMCHRVIAKAWYIPDDFDDVFDEYMVGVNPDWRLALSDDPETHRAWVLEALWIVYPERRGMVPTHVIYQGKPLLFSKFLDAFLYTEDDNT